MPKPVIIVIAALFGLAILAQTVTYTVRFTEQAVLTTFGKADEEDVVREPGLKFKLPAPIQSVTKYDTRVRFLETRIEQQQLADSNAVTVQAFCTWRVSDPLRFFQRFSNAGDRARDHYAKAESLLASNLLGAVGEIGKYGMSDLFTRDVGASKLQELEERILQTLRRGAGSDGADEGDRALASQGIEVTSVGISRIELPEAVTEQVFEAMRSERARLVRAIEARGNSEAEAIKSAASAQAAKIEAFAKAYAASIKQLGDLEATSYIEQMNEQPDLAVFLTTMDLIRDGMGKTLTLVFSTDMPGLDVLRPDAMAAMRDGQLPGVERLMRAFGAGAPTGGGGTPEGGR